LSGKPFLPLFSTRGPEAFYGTTANFQGGRSKNKTLNEGFALKLIQLLILSITVLFIDEQS